MESFKDQLESYLLSVDKGGEFSIAYGGLDEFGEPVDAEVYDEWTGEIIAQAENGGYVGGWNNTSISTGDGSAWGYSELSDSTGGTVYENSVNESNNTTAETPYTGPETTIVVTANRGPQEPTLAELRQAELDRQNFAAIQRANSLWNSIRAINALRGFTQLDGGGGGEPVAEDPYNRVSSEDIQGAGIDDAPDPTIDPRTPAQIAADDAAIEAATGVKIRGAGDVFEDPAAPSGVAPGGPGIDDAFDIDPRTDAQIAADDAAITAATGIKIVNATPVDSGVDTGLSRQDLNKLVDSVFAQINDLTPVNPDQAQAQIANIQTLLETDGFGYGLSADDRQYLQNQLLKDQAYVDLYNRTITVAGDIITELKDLSQSNAITDTGRYASSQLLEDYLGSLTPLERSILRSSGQLDFLSIAAGVPQPFRQDDFYITPYSSSRVAIGSIEAAIDSAVVAWISQNGSITDSQYAAIESAVTQEYRVRQQENLPNFVPGGPDSEFDPDVPGAFILRTSTSTTVPAADTDTVLTGSDTAPPSADPGERRVDTVAPAGVGAVYVSRYDAASGKYDVVNVATGQIVADDLTRRQADQQAEIANEGEPRPRAQPAVPTRAEQKSSPAPTGGNFTESFNPETGTYDVVNLDTGEVVATGLTEQQATVEAQNASVGDPSYGSGLAPTTPVARSSITATAAPTGGNFTESFNPETGSYDVVNLATGAVVATGLTEQQAIIAAQDASVGDPSYGTVALTEEEIQAQDNPASPDVDPYGVDGAGIGLTEEEIQAQDNPVSPDVDPYGVDNNNRELTEEEIQRQDNPVSPDVDPYEVDNNNRELTEEEIQAQDNPPSQTAEQQATLAKAQAQATLANQQKQANQGDWRVKLRLAPGANYLYRASDGKGSQAGILQPLAVTDGVVFPYTPVISTAYRANYSNYDLTHSNYRGYFYQGSAVEELTIQAMFTAQDTYEANYLLAVIHFFKAVTKMFYGQDAERGAPPPLVYLQGYGEYQFNLHPCVVTNFNYNLPNDVDYIRARSPNINGTSLLQARQRQTISTNPFAAAWERLQNAGLPKGGINTPPAAPTLGTNSPTYVPTKMDMTITLLPMQSREQQSQQFSLKQYANGDLLKGGFW